MPNEKKNYCTVCAQSILENASARLSALNSALDFVPTLNSTITRPSGSKLD